MLIRTNNFLAQIKASKREKRKEKADFSQPFPPPFLSGDLRRVVFCSISVLHHEWKKVPGPVLDKAVLCLDCDRKWVFHQFSEGKGSEKQLKHFKAQFDSRFMDFESDFLKFITLKETQGLVLWFRPLRDFKIVSAFFQKIDDPTQSENYGPLILDEDVWRDYELQEGWKYAIEELEEKKLHKRVRRPRFTASINKVLSNLKSGLIC